MKFDYQVILDMDIGKGFIAYRLWYLSACQRTREDPSCAEHCGTILPVVLASVSNMYLGSAPGFLIADSLVSDSDVSADRCKHDIATHDLWCCTGFTSLLHVDVLSW